MRDNHSVCPNCGHSLDPSWVPLNLDWTQWQDITWYDDQGRPITYPKYQTWFDDGVYIYRAILTDKIMRGKHKPDLWLYKASLSENTDAYRNGMWKHTPQLIRRSQFPYANSDWQPDAPKFDRVFGSRRNWTTVIAEFAEYCEQLVSTDIAKEYSDKLLSNGI